MTSEGADHNRAQSLEANSVRPGLRLHQGRAPRALLGLLNRYSYSFALTLDVVLFLIYVLQTRHVNWIGLIGTFAPLACAAMASTPAIISGGGGFDVSISPIMVMTTAVYAVYFIPIGLGGPVGIVALLALGGLVGLVNGLLIVRLRIQPVVVTLGMSFVITGVNIFLVPEPLFLSGNWIARLAGPQSQWPGALVIIALPLVIWTVLGRTAYRRTLLAVGSSDVTAFAAGVNVNLVRVAAYSLGGALAVFGGLAILATTSSVNASISGTYTVNAIAAVALGGTSLWGGRGGLTGSLLGAAAIYLLSSLLISMNVNPSWLSVLSGSMLLAAVVVVGLGSSHAARSKQGEAE
jgi:ribose transport system permease protein